MFGSRPSHNLERFSDVCAGDDLDFVDRVNRFGGNQRIPEQAFAGFQPQLLRLAPFFPGRVHTVGL